MNYIFISIYTYVINKYFFFRIQINNTLNINSFFAIRLPVFQTGSYCQEPNKEVIESDPM
jgi:accessory gene regulator protein AgrB